MTRIMFSIAKPALDDDEALQFDVKFIVKRVISWPRYRRGMDDQIAGRIAREIINHLRLANRRFRKGPPAAGEISC
jgi:hypothetical protein